MLASGWEALERDDFASAEAVARAALERDAADGEALYLLGSALLFQDRFDQALEPLRLASSRLSRRGVGHRLGYCYLAFGDLVQAESALRREVEAYPDFVPAYNALGVALVRQGKRGEALAVFEDALACDPQSAEANNNAANVLSELGRDEEALPYLQKVVQANPQHADAQYNLGTLLQSLGRHEEAIVALENALRISPRSPYALGYLVWNQLAICRWHDLEGRIEALRRQMREQAIPAAPFVLVALPGSNEEQRRCAELHVKQKFPRLPSPLWQGTRHRPGRLRIAYLSADFHEHATAKLAVGLFELHDRSRFETLATSYGPDDRSPMRERLQRAFDRFVDVREQSDAQIATMLREMEIDLAIDLKGHTTGARMGILAYRPAPIQISYLGFPGTSAAPFIDYVMADRFVIPEEQRRFYSESVVYLPDSYQVNDATRAIASPPVSRSELGLPPQGFVFCCFNSTYKITPLIFALWMRLLGALPGAVLWLLADDELAQHNLRQAARVAGIDPLRLLFAPRVPHGAHLARHALADLFLDTLPCNAHTTASDALWAGLPVLTAVGTTFAGRVAGSLLHAVGLPELVAADLEDYERLALRLASEPALLAQYKAKLQANRTGAALFDTGRTTRGIEAAYLAMWQRQERGLGPGSFEVTRFDV